MIKCYCYFDRMGKFRMDNKYIEDNPFEAFSFGMIEGLTLEEIELKCKVIFKNRIMKYRKEGKRD